MNEPKNEIEFNIDFQERRCLYLDFQPVQGDKRTYEFIMTPLKNGVAFTIDSGWIITVSVKRPNGTSVIDSATVLDGKIRYVLGDDFLNQNGVHVCTIEIFDGERRLTSNQFSWTTIEQTGGDDAVSNTNECPILIGLIDDVEELQEQYEEKVIDIETHIEDTNNPHSVTKDQIGLGNVNNTSDADKPLSTATSNALSAKSDIGHNHSLSNLTEKSYDSLTNKPDLSLKANLINGKVPSTELPSYVDDVIEVANYGSLPSPTGEAGKIYVTLDTNLTYRWSGSAYVEISQSLALGETSESAHRGDHGKAAYDHSQIGSGNPHGTTTSDIGAEPAFSNLPIAKGGTNNDTYTSGNMVEYDGAKLKSSVRRSEPIFGLHWNKATPSVPTRTFDAVGMIANVGLDASPAYNMFDTAPIFSEIVQEIDSYGNYFMRIPKFYIKKSDGGSFWAKEISKSPITGGYLPKIFWDFTNEIELPYAYIGKYTGYLNAGKMESKPNLYPTINRSIVQHRADAQANNTGGLLGYQQLDIHMWDVLQTLMDIEFGTFNLQSIMAGFSSGQYSASHTAIADTAGNTIQVTNVVGANYRVGQTISVGTSLGGNQIFYGRTITNIQADTPGAGTTTITFDGSAVNITTGNILYNTAWKSGWSSIMTASSGGIGNLTDGKYPMMYRGIENVYGDVYQWCDGININGGSGWALGTNYHVGETVIGNNGSDTTDTWLCIADHTSTADDRPTTGVNYASYWANLNGRQLWVCEDARNYASNLFADPYKKLNYVIPPTNNWIKDEGYDSTYPFATFPKTVSATSTYFYDYLYQSAGLRVARVGGGWYNGSGGGVRCWVVNSSSASASLNVVGRLLKKAL